MSQGLRVMQKYLNNLRIFHYHANDKRRYWNRKKEGRLERALEEAITVFVPGSKTPLAVVVTITLSVNRHLDGERRLYVEIISLDIEEPQDCRTAPTDLRSPRPWSTPVRAAFNTVRVAFSSSRTESNASIPVVTGRRGAVERAGEAVQGRRI